MAALRCTRCNGFGNLDFAFQCAFDPLGDTGGAA